MAHPARTTDILPPPAIYLPTETGEGACLLYLVAEGALDVALDEADILADLLPVTVGLGEYAPYIVWPKETADGAYECQSSGEDIEAEETLFYTKPQMVAHLADWVAASE